MYARTCLYKQNVGNKKTSPRYGDHSQMGGLWALAPCNAPRSARALVADHSEPWSWCPSSLIETWKSTVTASKINEKQGKSVTNINIQPG